MADAGGRMIPGYDTDRLARALGATTGCSPRHFSHAADLDCRVRVEEYGAVLDREERRYAVKRLGQDDQRIEPMPPKFARGAGGSYAWHAAKSPAEAWELLHLAGLVPAEALEDAGRRWLEFVSPGHVVTEWAVGRVLRLHHEYERDRAPDGEVFASRMTFGRETASPTTRVRVMVEDRVTTPPSGAIELTPLDRDVCIPDIPIAAIDALLPNRARIDALVAFAPELDVSSRVALPLRTAPAPPRPVHRAMPPRVVDAVAFAAAWPRVVAAEELARQLVARLAGAIPQTAPIVWTAGTSVAWVQPPEPLLGSLEVVMSGLDAQCATRRLPRMLPGSPEWRDLARWGAEQWARCITNPCPFSPLLALWEMNVGIVSVAPDAITLRWEALDARPEDYR